MDICLFSPNLYTRNISFMFSVWSCSFLFFSLEYSCLPLFFFKDLCLKSYSFLSGFGHCSLCRPGLFPQSCLCAAWSLCGLSLWSVMSLFILPLSLSSPFVSVCVSFLFQFDSLLSCVLYIQFCFPCRYSNFAHLCLVFPSCVPSL